MKTILKNLIPAGLCLLVISCSAENSTNTDSGGTTQTALVRYSSCDDLLSDFQQRAIKQMEATLDYYTTCTPDIIVGEDGGPAPPSDDGAGESSAPTDVDFTDTNIQEANVDEADIIKTDGTTIYVATSQGVDVFKAWPLDEFSKIGSYSDANGVQNIFLNDDRLILLSTEYDDIIYAESVSTDGTDTIGSSSPVTTISVLSIENPAAPTLIFKKKVQGWLASARLVADVVHVAVNSYMQPYALTGLDTLSTEQWSDDCSEDTLATLIKQVKEENRTAILATTIDNWALPGHSDGNDTSWEVDCTDFAKDTGSDEYNLLGLFSVDVEADGSDEEITFVVGYAQEIYASTGAFYLASNNWMNEETLLHRFVINSGSGLHEYVASTSVKGSVNDSFSMSEFEDTFRIATSTRWTGTPTNQLYVLDISDNDLPVLGKVENIADGEQIYAARFIGTRGYLVTFEQIDPLFVIDLSDPTNPVIQGELVMPGVSTYLHPLDDNHLIGLGRGTEDGGEFSWFQGIKLALFDVTNGNNPSIVDELLFGSRGTDSAALVEHHAFTFENASGLLALPLTLYTGGSDVWDYGTFEYNGVHLYTISADGGIDTVAEISISTDMCDVPSRTIILGDETEKGLYVLDTNNLHRVKMGGSYNVLDSKTLTGTSDEVCWYGGVPAEEF